VASTGNLLRLAAVAIAILAVAVAVGGWLVLGGFERVQDSGVTSAATFETLHRTVDISVETTGTVSEALSDLERLVALVASSSETTAAFVGDAADVTANRIPESLEAIERAMPGLIDAGAVIDDSLSALALFGVDYNPAVPFDEALRDLQSSLDGLSGDVAAQGATLGLLVPEMREVGATASDLAGRIRDTRDNLETAQILLADYEQILRETEVAIGTAYEPLRFSPLARALFVVIGLVGIALGAVLWKLGAERDFLGGAHGMGSVGVGRSDYRDKEVNSWLASDSYC